MFAYVEGKRIYVEGFFADGKKAKESKVSVFDKNGNEIANGVTDAEGLVFFPIPKKTDLRLVLNAGMGHQTEYIIPANEFSGVNATQQTTKTEEKKSTREEAPLTISPQVENIQTVVNQSVATAIKPLMRTIAEMREEKSLANLIGGIGYIFGILGLALYFKTKKEQS